jgi:hypothetical protein
MTTMHIIEAGCKADCSPADPESDCGCCGAWFDEEFKLKVEEHMKKLNVQVEWVGLLGRMSLPRFIVDGVCYLGKDNRFVNDICNLGFACDSCAYNKNK